MSMLVNGKTHIDPNNVPLASLVAQEDALTIYTQIWKSIKIIIIFAQLRISEDHYGFPRKIKKEVTS
jgi:hypothetical protein